MVTTTDNNRATWQDPPTRAAVDTSAFPAELDPEFYRSQYPELAHFDAGLLDQHYALYGINEGRPGNRIKDRRDFVALIPGTARVLEIGPYFSPLMVGDNVEYFDVLSREDLIRRAVSQGVENPNPPFIHWLSPTGDLSVVEAKFDFAVSSYCVEHQPDLIKHLNDVSGVLHPGGCYFALIPDKRYCHDHFLAESTLAGVIDAHHARRTTHSLRSVIEHVALTAHNDQFRHWIGDHGEYMDDYKNRVRTAVDVYERANGQYVDVHSWYFTPNSARRILAALNELGYCDLHCIRCYETRRNNNDFWMILQKE
jgi:SAM-dependent methyltransferase